MNNRVFEVNETHRFIVESFKFHSPIDQQVGSIRLRNLYTNRSESYPVWSGNNTLSNFYVCLPTGDSEGNGIEKFDFNLFHEVVPIHFYNQLQWESSVG